MKILSMTATFGKLSQQTLTLEPGMNIIEAPNEWGKSTWCAFLMSMLYGIDTASRTKTGFLADKEHYAPWSGAPMSGRMDILWNGREITIERQNKGRIPFGEVKAFETHTGVSVPELCVAMPGQVLLGVERSVYARSGFLRLSEMPVTEDDSLRRRLNILVTTGDESGASDDLAQKLRDLKNKCRFNKKGLLPELETQKAEIEQKLQQISALETQIAHIKAQQKDLETQARVLENHRQALAYEENLQYAQKLATAQVGRDTAHQNLLQAQAECEGLPTEEQLREKLSALQQLRDTRDTLHTKAQLLPPLPVMPVSSDIFRGKDPKKAVEDAKSDRILLLQLQNGLKKAVPNIFTIVCLALAVVLDVLHLIFGGILLPVCAGVLLIAGLVFGIAGRQKRNKLKRQISDLQARYGNISENAWEAEAISYATTQENYTDTLTARQEALAELNRKLEENTLAIDALTDGANLAQFEADCKQQLEKLSRLQEKQRSLKQAEDVLQALSGAGKPVQPPQFEDTLTLSYQDTEAKITETTAQRHLLQQRLGQCEGQMESLGNGMTLNSQKQQLSLRIAKLETYYNALTRAQETLLQATQELQRRFAPRISQRAQELFGRLTSQRYQRLSLCQDLSLEAGAEGETTLRGTLWRSDGTVDQLYLALRLAVAEALTPEAPLVLDDALVRFDDVRLATALEILREESTQKQVILFTCQGREKQANRQ